MTQLRDSKAVLAWLHQLGIDNVIVISPHLDDAVYSIGSFLNATRNRAEVVTVFTEALSGQPADWARLAGFADSEAEHLARRQEDVLAMNSLGCRFQHLGFCPREATEALVSEVVTTFRQARPDGLGQTLVLLPAGAGGPPSRSRILRLALRCIRRPSGVIPHGEHVETRNLFWHALLDSDARIGFYAELPYAWAHSDRQLQQHLHIALGCQTARVELLPDIAEKGQLVELYRSQLVPIFGHDRSYRERVLARNECILVVEPHPGNEQRMPLRETSLLKIRGGSLRMHNHLNVMS